MGDDATSAESALFSPSRSRPVERTKNRSWRTSSAARHSGSVALGIFLPELTAQTQDLRTSKRSAAASESSPICSRCCFRIQTARRPSAAQQWEKVESVEAIDAIEWEKQTSERTLHGGGISAASALRSPPRTYPRREAQSDVSEPAKRSRRSCGVAMSTYEETYWSCRKI